MCVILNAEMDPNTSADFNVENVEKVRYVGIFTLFSCGIMCFYRYCFNINVVYSCGIV